MSHQVGGWHSLYAYLVLIPDRLPESAYFLKFPIYSLQSLYGDSPACSV